ncbi:MAG: hypothetical protein HKN11_18350 [Rhizobiales bacterium]|nr:hypothetical protein [Hyphomicrobiales bacterium]
MASLLQRLSGDKDVPERVRLDLSGPVLTQALQKLVAGSEALGGVERYAAVLQLKSQMFKDALADGKVKDLDLDALMGLCTFMATVRRRIAAYLDPTGFALIKQALTELLDGARDTTTTDARWTAFCEKFPQDKRHRWVRDMAAEVLHNTDPERYPLMGRWIWDAKANTGVVREIWYGESVDHMTIPVPDGYETYVVLREELTQFLTNNGVFQGVLEYCDLLCGQIYAEYISAQGGSYLKADFTSEQDPMEHTRRILGLDGVKPGSTRTRLKSIDGEAFVLDDVKLLD